MKNENNILKQILQNLVAEGKTGQAIEQLREATATDKYLQQDILSISARYAHYERELHSNTADNNWLSRERNQIDAALLYVIGKLDDDITIPNTQNNNQNTMTQTHHGSGDNIAGNKIGRQVNMGAGSTYVENNSGTLNVGKAEASKPAAPVSETQKTPETPSGLLAMLFGWLPKPIRPIVAIALLGLGSYVCYNYFMPSDDKPKEEVTTTVAAPEKVFVSGIIRINNGDPKPHEIKRVALRDIDVNSATVDPAGKFTFKNVKIPTNKRLLVDITFADGKTIPTEEMIVDEADIETKTVLLPLLNATRPQAAKNGKPATGWKMQVNINNGSGTINATQN